MTEFKNGDVFLVNFDPSVGHEYKKIRPVVVIQSDRIKNTPLITIMPVTSQFLNKQKEDIRIVKSVTNGLYMDSLVKVGCIHSFDRSRFLGKIGNISEPTIDKIIAYLCMHFDIK